MTKKGKTTVLVPENRPYMVGLKYNIPLLRRENVPLVYCTDNMLGALFYRGKIKELLLSYKEIRAEGIISGCGSLFAVVLAHLHQVQIKGFVQGAFPLKGVDKDASSLGGKKFVLPGEEPFIQEAGDEIIEKCWQIIEVKKISKAGRLRRQ